MATIYWRSENAWLNWTDEHGQRHREPLGPIPQKVADDILRAKQLELSTGAKLLNLQTSPTQLFGQIAQRYLEWHELEWPDSHYRVKQILEQHIIPRYEFRLPTEADGNQYKQDRKKEGAKSQTVVKELRVWKACLRWAVDREMLVKHPLALVRSPKILDSKPPLFYQAEEMDMLYAASTSEHAPIWKLFANTGMRRGEGMILRRSWIGREAMKILSTEEERTKSGKWREIPVSDGARDALERIPKGDYVLPRMYAESVSRACMRDLSAAGLAGSLHTLRHTYISHLVMGNVPLRTVQIWAGHAHITTTERYAHLAPKTTHAAARGLAL